MGGLARRTSEPVLSLVLAGSPGTLRQCGSGSGLAATAPVALEGRREPDCHRSSLSQGSQLWRIHFDQSFARLAGDLGLRYYPKLIGMSPVSPVQGYRFHIHPDEDAQDITVMMLRLIDEFAARNNILSCNFLYVDPLWQPLAEAAAVAW